MSTAHAKQIVSANEDICDSGARSRFDEEMQQAMSQALESAFHMTGVAQILEYYGFN